MWEILTAHLRELIITVSLYAVEYFRKNEKKTTMEQMIHYL